MKVSIVIPTHNRASLIERSIKSIQEQTHTDWELLIVDDGSTDNTSEIILPLLSDSRIKYIPKTNSGPAHSRNFGANLATAEILTFLDSDDEVEKNWLELMTEKFTDDSVAVVCCGVSTFDKDGNLIRSRFPGNLGPTFDYVVGKFTNSGIFMLRNSVFQAIGGYDEELKANQHTEFGMRLVPYLIQHKLRIENIDKHLLKIHFHVGPRIRGNHNSVFEGTRRMIDKHLERIKRDKRQFRNFLVTLIFNAWKSGRKSEAKPYVAMLVKNFPLQLKTWYYLGVYLFR